MSMFCEHVISTILVRKRVTWLNFLLLIAIFEHRFAKSLRPSIGHYSFTAFFVAGRLVIEKLFKVLISKTFFFQQFVSVQVPSENGGIKRTVEKRK